MPPQKVKTCFHICLVEKKNETVGLPPLPSPPPYLAQGITGDT